jgi:hypothetical protein
MYDDYVSFIMMPGGPEFVEMEKPDDLREQELHVQQYQRERDIISHAEAMPMFHCAFDRGLNGDMTCCNQQPPSCHLQ